MLIKREGMGDTLCPIPCSRPTPVPDQHKGWQTHAPPLSSPSPTQESGGWATQASGGRTRSRGISAHGDHQHRFQLSTLSSEGGSCDSALESLSHRRRARLLVDGPLCHQTKGKSVINRKIAYHDTLIEEPQES
ncbi:hypothetical protein FQN60_005288 [Etheostoma spectabile]|uniref:Uncharacterized protein n=1 Tax=Etheostoma spectabile TaxID=54343 RepID=A0A5J5CCU7_9PERO|nr:hypothetical protein FQN60_005288 [Etheostoma spectabile]